MRTFVGDVIVGLQPILPQNNRIGRHAAHLLDEAGQMPGDLRVGWAIIGLCRRHGLGLAKFVDLLPPRAVIAAARGLPDKATRKDGTQGKHAEEGEPPILGLNAGVTDAIVPNLAGALIRVFPAGACGRNGRTVSGTLSTPLQTD